MEVGKDHVRVVVSASRHHHYHHTIVASIVVVIAMIVVAVIPVRVHHVSVSKPDQFARPFQPLIKPLLSQQTTFSRTIRVIPTRYVCGGQVQTQHKGTDWTEWMNWYDFRHLGLILYSIWQRQSHHLKIFITFNPLQLVDTWPISFVLHLCTLCRL